MRFVLVLACMTVFDDCGNLNAPPPAPKPTTPSLPYCSTDPLQGCVAVCMDPSSPPTLVWCDGPGSGPRANQFAADAANYEAQAEAQTGGMTLCTYVTPGTAVATPCQDGIPPILSPPNQSPEVCTVPPP